MRCYAFPYIYRDIRLKSVVSNPCIQRPRISPCYGIVRSGGLYEAGNVSYGIPYSGPVTTALSTPCPPPTPSPHLVSCFAPHTLLHPTSNSALPLCLCPGTAPRVRVRVRPVLIFFCGRTCILLWILYGNMVDFPFIVSLCVSDLPNVISTLAGAPYSKQGRPTT